MQLKNFTTSCCDLTCKTANKDNDETGKGSSGYDVGIVVICDTLVVETQTSHRNSLKNKGKKFIYDDNPQIFFVLIAAKIHRDYLTIA